MSREDFQRCYYKAHSYATDRVGAKDEKRCWGDILADKFCELYNKMLESKEKTNE